MGIQNASPPPLSHSLLKKKKKNPFTARLAQSGLCFSVCFCTETGKWSVNVHLLALYSRSFLSIFLLEEWGLNNGCALLGR